MGDIDCLFYDLDKYVDSNLLHKMYEDYRVFLKEQERANGNKLGEIPQFDEEEPEHNINNSMNTRVDRDVDRIENNMMINDDMDLLEVDNLTLRRGNN